MGKLRPQLGVIEVDPHDPRGRRPVRPPDPGAGRGHPCPRGRPRSLRDASIVIVLVSPQLVTRIGKALSEVDRTPVDRGCSGGGWRTLASSVEGSRSVPASRSE
jgi:hypothetical protein